MTLSISFVPLALQQLWYQAGRERSNCPVIEMGWVVLGHKLPQLGPDCKFQISEKPVESSFHKKPRNKMPDCQIGPVFLAKNMGNVCNMKLKKHWKYHWTHGCMEITSNYQTKKCTMGRIGSHQNDLSHPSTRVEPCPAKAPGWSLLFQSWVNLRGRSRSEKSNQIDTCDKPLVSCYSQFGFVCFFFAFWWSLDHEFIVGSRNQVSSCNESSRHRVM